MATSIASDIYDGVRIDCGDEDGVVLTSAFLQRVFTKAVRRLNRTLGLSVTNRPQGIPGYKSLSVSPITYSIANDTISPDNDELVDMVILQMEYIIKKSETSALKRLNASYGGVLSTNANMDDATVRNADGVTVSLGQNRLSNRARLYAMDLEAIQKELDAAIKSFLGRQIANYGKMIY